MDLDGPVNTDPRRGLPSVDRLIREVSRVDPAIPGWAVRRAARDALAVLRRHWAEIGPSGSNSMRSQKDPISSAPELAELVDQVAGAARRMARPHPRRVLNATGVVLHTNLGRAPLSPAAARAVREAAAGYSSLELDLESGRRGSRMGPLEAKLCALSGAEAGLVVNNCAAAVLLALNTLAMGREVIVSRGELVEIGGSFRVPAIMERAGVRLIEVGTTNRTHLEDYAAAIGAETALLLKVHRSNFEQRGFVAETDLAQLAELARERGLPLLEDLGSGSLLPAGEAGLPAEAFVPGRLALGADLVCFSGDKLLGGPQAGLVVGRAAQIELLRRNPLARALRVDKLTVAALDATFDALLDPAREGEIPVVAGLRRSAEDLERAAHALAEQLAPHLPEAWRQRVAPSEAAVGGGSLPELRLAGYAVVLEGPRVNAAAARLRAAPMPVLARIADDALWLDLRTLPEQDWPALCESVEAALR